MSSKQVGNNNYFILALKTIKYGGAEAISDN
jgi:hypothetical protein